MDRRNRKNMIQGRPRRSPGPLSANTSACHSLGTPDAENDSKAKLGASVQMQTPSEPTQQVRFFIDPSEMQTKTWDIQTTIHSEGCPTTPVTKTFRNRTVRRKHNLQPSMRAVVQGVDLVEARSVPPREHLV